MHLSSYQHMEELVDSHLDPAKPLVIIDIGSCDVNGTYKPLFDKPGWHYRGVDLEPGSNVDIILSSPYRLPLAEESCDVLVSGQVFEHIEFFWLAWQEMLRVLKPGGLVLLIAPSRGYEHRYPVDCWRFYPDSFHALARYGACELLQVSTDWDDHQDCDSATWGDTVGVFRKNKVSWRRKLAINALLYIERRFVGAA